MCDNLVVKLFLIALETNGSVFEFELVATTAVAMQI